MDAREWKGEWVDVGGRMYGWVSSGIISETSGISTLFFLYQ